MDLVRATHTSVAELNILIRFIARTFGNSFILSRQFTFLHLLNRLYLFAAADLLLRLHNILCECFRYASRSRETALERHGDEEDEESCKAICTRKIPFCNRLTSLVLMPYRKFIRSQQQKKTSRNITMKFMIFPFLDYLFLLKLNVAVAIKST